MEYFKSKFPKDYDVQWSLAGASFLNIVTQVLTFGFSRWVKNDIELRFIMEMNQDRFYTCTCVFVLSWAAIYFLRSRMDTVMAIGLLNINVLSWVYINGQVGEFSDPDRAHTFILCLFMLGDAISNWLQVLVSSEINVVSNVLWCLFGKLCLFTSVMIIFDDRRQLICQYLVLSVLMQVIQSITQCKIIKSKHIKQQGGILNWVLIYVLLFLDIPFQLHCLYNTVAKK